MTTTEPMTRVRWLTPEEQSVWRAFLDVSRLMSEQMNRQLSDESGMSLPEYEILVALSEAPGRRLRMNQLAEVCQSSRSRLSHAVNRLEEAGWVRREACPTDKRGALAVMTDEGFAAIEAAAPGHVEGVRRHVFDVLTPEQIRELGDISAAIRDGLLRG